nr:MAG TPA: hypothetical protein [Caudoviricetes sp.]
MHEKGAKRSFSIRTLKRTLTRIYSDSMRLGAL